MNLLEKKTIFKQIAAVFFIQATSTIAYAVFYSGLSIYLTQNKNYTQQNSATLTGLFLSLNYLLPLIGGALVYRFVSYKGLYFIGMIISLLGCFMLATGHYLNLSLSLFLMGSLTNVSVSMFVTQLKLLIQNSSIKVIAAKLKLSCRTVEHYIENIKNKMQVESKSALISHLMNALSSSLCVS